MELMLRKDVPGLGKSGAVVTVADGYGRNYLLPKKLAIPVSSKNLKLLELERRKLELGEKGRVEELVARAEALSLVSCTIVASATPEGHLFGSVTASQIVEALAKEDFELSPEAILLEKPIKGIGVYQIAAKLHPEVQTSFKLWVIAE